MSYICYFRKPITKIGSKIEIDDFDEQYTGLITLKDEEENTLAFVPVLNILGIIPIENKKNDEEEE